MFRRSFFAIKKMKDLFKYSSTCAASHIKYSAHTLSAHFMRLNYNKNFPFIKTAMTWSLFRFYPLEEEKSVENELILDIKRSILLIQRKDFAKAEQMLHLALRTAQQIQNEDGITYIFDVMANLAFSLGQYDKAEKLFVDVMQRLLAKGVPENDIKNIHISIKLARICHMKGDKEKAGIGYRWSIEHLQKFIGGDVDSEYNVLLAIATDWFARISLEAGNYAEALRMMHISYEILEKFPEGNEEQSAIMLNDMATMYEKLDDIDNAEIYLKKAIKCGNLLKDMEELGAMYVNLGRIYLRKELLDKARKCCGYGWKLSIDRGDSELKSEAQLCLDDAVALQRRQKRNR